MHFFLSCTLTIFWSSLWRVPGQVVSLGGESQSCPRSPVPLPRIAVLFPTHQLEFGLF